MRLNRSCIISILLLSLPFQAAFATEKAELKKMAQEAVEILFLVPDMLTSTGERIVSDPAENSKLFTQITELAHSSKTLVIVSDRYGRSSRNEIQQIDSAYSSWQGGHAEIQICANHWQKIRGDRLAQVGLLAHEVAVLLGKEETGKYGLMSAPLIERLQLKKIKPDPKRALFVCLLRSNLRSVELSSAHVEFPFTLGVISLNKTDSPSVVYSMCNHLFVSTIEILQKATQGDLWFDMIPPDFTMATPQVAVGNW